MAYDKRAAIRRGRLDEGHPLTKREQRRYDRIARRNRRRFPWSK